jgi:hypothetical protein
VRDEAVNVHLPLLAYRNASSATASQWAVCGNMSNGVTRSSL